MRILVVDGKNSERREIVEALSQLDGISVQGAVPDLTTAVRVLGEAAPDIVVAGTELTDGDGIQLIEEVRRHDARTSIVVVGPSPSREHWRRHLDAGADRFVEPDPGLGELRQVVGALARQLSAQQTDSSERLIGRLAGGIAHDFNNYLGIIDLLVARLERSPSPELFGETRTAIAQAKRLTSSLLAIVSNQRETALTKLDFGALVRDTIALVKHAIPEPITVAVEIEDNLPAMSGVASELEQVVLNLVLNAAESMPEGGELHVRVSASTHTLMLQVSDTGVGMGTRLFDPMARSTKGDRDGLGLRIVHTVVARHGGSLAMAAREPRGTLIRVKFPW